MDINLFKETIDTLWCVSCGERDWQKRGYAEDGKTRIRCRACKKSITIGAGLPGNKPFKPERLLPVLTKSKLAFTAGELYSLGLLVADGGRKGKNNIDNMCISLTYEDAYLLDILKAHLQFPNSVKEYTRIRKRDNGSTFEEHYKEVSWSNNYAGRYWDDLGLFKQKTGKEIFLPYMCSSDFLRGLFDGDGNFYLSKNIKVSGRIELVSANKQFLEDIKNFLCEILMLEYPRKIYTKNKGKEDWYQLFFYGSDIIKIGNYIYRNSKGLRLERKYNKYLEIKNRHMNETQPSVSN